MTKFYENLYIKPYLMQKMPWLGHPRHLQFSSFYLLFCLFSLQFFLLQLLMHLPILFQDLCLNSHFNFKYEAFIIIPLSKPNPLPNPFPKTLKTPPPPSSLPLPATLKNYFDFFFLILNVYF